MRHAATHCRFTAKQRNRQGMLLPGRIENFDRVARREVAAVGGPGLKYRRHRTCAERTL
jgi:hypothetical protein